MEQVQHKIMLIEPPFHRLYKDTFSLTRYPLSLGYLAGTIKKETDWGVMAYNTDFNPQSESPNLSYITGVGFNNYLKNLKELSAPVWAEIKATISAYQPTVVGISAKSQNFTSACIVAKIAKELNKQILVIVGGPHPSMVGSEVLNCKDIDICVKGEGEQTIVELLDTIKRQQNLEQVNGIIFRKNNQIVETPNRRLIEDLDSLCFPGQSAQGVLKDYDKYPLQAFRNIFATRGCPYQCFFCGSQKIWSRKVRFRSPINVIEEIKTLQKKGLRLIHFEDDIFGVTRPYINQLCNALIAHCPGLKWSCELHVKLVDEHTISIMKAAGCYLIQLGIESGNNQVLKKIRKDIDVEEALSACETIKKYKIELFTFFIVGFPQETEDTLKDTLSVIKKVKSDVVVYSIFTPYPSTEAFEFCKSHGLIDSHYDVSLYNHQSPANCFCVNISHQRFRRLVRKIEKYTDQKRVFYYLKHFCSLSFLYKIFEYGIGRSLRRAIRVLMGESI